MSQASIANGAEVGTRRWAAWLTPVALVALVLLAAGLRSGRLTANELWLDEADAALQVMVPQTFSQMIHRLQTDYNPPLYYVALRPWVQALGTSECALKSFSVFWGVTLVLVVFFAARELLGPPAAWIASLLVTVHPLLIYYAQEVRPYSMLVTLTTLSMWMLWRLMREGGVLNALLYGLTTAAVLYTHNYGVFVAPAGVVAALAVGSDRGRWKELVRVFVPAAAAGLAFLPWFIFVNLHLVEAGGLDWIASLFNGYAPLSSMETFTPGGSYPRYLRHLSQNCQPLEVVRVLAMLMAAALSGLALLKPTLGANGRRRVDGRAIFLAVWVLVPLTLPYLYSLVGTPIYLVGRYDQIALVPFVMLLALGAGKLGRSAQWAWVVTAVFVLFAGLALYPFYVKPRSTPLSTRTAEAVMKASAPEDLVVFTGLARAPNEYQLRQRGFAGAFLSYPLSASDHLGWFSYEREAARLDALRADIETVLARAAGLPSGAHLWVYLYLQEPWRDRRGKPTDAAAVDGLLLTGLEQAGWRPSDVIDYRTFRTIRYRRVSHP